jgi:hypothetical protein
MKRLLIYVDASVVGGCEDEEFAEGSLALWRLFIEGKYIMALSEHTLRELAGAPEPVRLRLREVPEAHRVMIPDNPEADALAAAYVAHGIVGPGSHADALHVALATVSHSDVLVSWNFKHIVNLRRIRLFDAVNLESDYPGIEIRTPLEILRDEEDL